jgi:AraC family transcriptional regulator, regulatory protein of adaptative response / methylated-DNA-[protein]-cysteine methyltransferase
MTIALSNLRGASGSRLRERARPARTSAAYRHGGAEMRIDYTIVASPLGRLLLGATGRGACAVYLGESDARLEAALRKEYPGARICRAVRGSSNLEAMVEKILAHLRGREANLDLPADVRGTAFERRVWDELRRIPRGATRTYREIARAIGNPSAIRAVARACAANPVALVVPCHRVVRTDGRLAGYRWGVDRKRALIEGESENFFGITSSRLIAGA